MSGVEGGCGASKEGKTVFEFVLCCATRCRRRRRRFLVAANDGSDGDGDGDDSDGGSIAMYITTVRLHQHVQHYTACIIHECERIQCVSEVMARI